MYPPRFHLIPAMNSHHEKTGSESEPVSEFQRKERESLADYSTSSAKDGISELNASLAR